MKAYPICPIFKNYKGKDALRQQKVRERNDVMREVVDFINADISKKSDDVKMYSPTEVAQAIGRRVKMVQDIMNELDGGSNGITVCIGNGLDQLHWRA